MTSVAWARTVTEVSPAARLALACAVLLACGGEVDGAPTGSAVGRAGAAGLAGGEGGSASAGGSGSAGEGGTSGGGAGAGGGGGSTAGGGAAGAGGVKWTCAPTPGAGPCAPCAAKACCPELMACYGVPECTLADIAYDQCQKSGADACLAELDAGGDVGAALRACKAEHCAPKCN